MTVSGIFRWTHANLLLAAALCCFASPAHAALSTLTVNATLPSQAADFADQPLTFSEFDPSLGKLQSVRIIVHSASQLTQEYENTSDHDQTIASHQTLDLILELPDGTTPVIKDRHAITHTYSASEFDGTIDFDGTSGSTSEYDISSTNQKLLKSHAKLAMFTGSGLASLFLSANSTFDASNEQNQLVAQAQAFTGVEVGIVYSYIAAVPEPVSYGLAAGLLAFVPFICGLWRGKAGRNGIRQ